MCPLDQRLFPHGIIQASRLVGEYPAQSGLPPPGDPTEADASPSLCLQSQPKTVYYSLPDPASPERGHSGSSWEVLPSQLVRRSSAGD